MIKHAPNTPTLTTLPKTAPGGLTAGGWPGDCLQRLRHRTGVRGLPLAVALAEAGVSVVGFDVNPERVAGLRAGRSGIEDVPDAAVATRGLRFSDDPADLDSFQAYILCVPTPLREGMPHLGAVESATRTVAAVLRTGDLAVLHLQPAHADCPALRGDVVSRIFDTGLCLPSAPTLSESQQDRVLDGVLSALRGR